MRWKKAQATLEFLLVIAIGILILIPITWHFFSNYRTTNLEFLAEDMAQSVGKTAEMVYALGPGNERYLTLNVPEGITLAIISNNEIVVKYHAYGGETEAQYTSKVNMTGTIPTEQGRYPMHLILQDDGVVRISGP